MSKKKIENSNNDNYACKNIYYPRNDWLSLCDKCNCNRSIHTHEYRWGRIVKIK